jgi:hypothetical protein
MTAPLPAPMAPPLNTRCSVGDMFAHPVTANIATNMTTLVLFIPISLLLKKKPPIPFGGLGVEVYAGFGELPITLAAGNGELYKHNEHFHIIIVII